MDATKRIGAILLAAGIGGLATACASNKPGGYTAFSEHQGVLEQCLDNLDSAVRNSLGTPPQFEDLKQAVSWTRQHLPPDIQAAFTKAAQSTIKDALPNDLSTLARNKEQLHKLLYHSTAQELGKLAQYQAAGCDIVVPEKLSNTLDLTLNLSHGSMKKNFDALGLTDSYYIENAYLLMLTLDASGAEWDEKWLSKP